ncbi:hypothetical protein LIER_06611 [Lithospermum erythrorhizon]|uniref:Uncharacterized protein n=1 Tax=Lithospermum erythrorhizon TaxID=34254 RepID=A0AAV3P568_LITER
MANQETSSQKRPTLKNGGIVERTLEEVCLARLVASYGGHFLLEGLTFQESQMENLETEEEPGGSSKVSASK